MALTFNGITPTKIIFNGVELDKIVNSNGELIWQGFDPSSVLRDFEYTDNGDNTYTLTGWKGTKDGVLSTECIIPDNSSIIL